MVVQEFLKYDSKVLWTWNESFFRNYKNWLKRGKNHNNYRLDEKVKFLPMKVNKARYM